MKKSLLLGHQGWQAMQFVEHCAETAMEKLMEDKF